MQSRLLRLAAAGLRSAKPALLDETCLVWFVSQATPVRFWGEMVMEELSHHLRQWPELACMGK